MLSIIGYPWVAKVYKALAVNLKVKLESRFQSVGCYSHEWAPCFIYRTKIYQSLIFITHVCGNALKWVSCDGSKFSLMGEVFRNWGLCAFMVPGNMTSCISFVLLPLREEKGNAANGKTAYTCWSLRGNRICLVLLKFHNVVFNFKL